MKDLADGALLSVSQPSPFLKWAGGKTQLLTQFSKLYPKSFNNYFEPFLGAGAVFFELRGTHRIKKAYLNDSNKDLMNLWSAVKLELEELINELMLLQKQTDNEKLFYERRKEYNSIDLSSEFLEQPDVRKAALLVFLNKTCYNGLYRVNANGKFNVPFGSYRKPRLFSLANLRAVNKVLQDHGRIILTALDFEDAVREAGRNDFAYLDPPYQPLTSTSRFTSYTAGGFGQDQQARLAKVFADLDSRRCHVMESNSLSRSFLEPLYTKYLAKKMFETVKAARAISSKALGRGAIEELVIMNYEIPGSHQTRMDKF
jgi:DNA adenine methylase